MWLWRNEGGKALLCCYLCCNEIDPRRILCSFLWGWRVQNAWESVPALFHERSMSKMTRTKCRALLFGKYNTAYRPWTMCYDWQRVEDQVMYCMMCSIAKDVRMKKFKLLLLLNLSDDCRNNGNCSMNDNPKQRRPGIPQNLYLLLWTSTVGYDAVKYKTGLRGRPLGEFYRPSLYKNSWLCAG